MKRIMSAVAALGLVLGACGSGDEPAADASDESSTEATDASADVTDGEMAGDQSNDAAGQTDEGNGDDGTDAGPIRSISDVPEVCRKEMAGFLRAIEPIVSSTDWESATMDDFQGIADEFAAKSEEFAAASAASCDNLDFVGENESELLIEFAQDEAPGVVGFLEFLSALGAVGTDGDSGDSGDAGLGGTLKNCDEALTFIQHLADTYNSMADVPASELFKFSQFSTVIGTCTPAQLEALNSGDIADFLAG
jgi:hypothetical protein